MKAIPEPPGEFILAALELLGMTQVALAKQTGVTAKHVNQIIHGTTGFSAYWAVRFEEVVGVPAEHLMKVRADYDLAVARERRSDELWLECEKRRAMLAQLVEGKRP